MSFSDYLSERSADTYADFLMPHLEEDSLVLDCGTAEGAIAVGIASRVPKGQLIAMDREWSESKGAARYATSRGIGSLRFLGGDAHHLPFRDGIFDVAWSHSVLETLADPVGALEEMGRVLRPGGLVAVASVEYTGVICSGPCNAETAHFYALKEQIWELDGHADPRSGQHLRRHLHAAGFREVEATAKYVTHGTTAEVRAFGRGRAADCAAPWFADAVRMHGLGSREDLDGLRRAWLQWSEAPDAFAAFSWCRAIGRKPPVV